MADTVKINDTTWRVEDGMVRFFVLEGSQKAFVIDSGMTTADARKIAEGLTSKPLELINTHADRDHIAGNGGFEKIYMSLNEEENYRSAGGTGEITAVHNGDIIDPGDRPLEIISIPGHTPGSIAILDRNARVLISGDTIQDGNIFMFGKTRHLQMFILSVAKLSTRMADFDEIWPSHGSFPVKPELIGQILEGAISIGNGNKEYEIMEMFGTKVRHYKFPYAGFFCDEDLLLRPYEGYRYENE